MKNLLICVLVLLVLILGVELQSRLEKSVSTGRVIAPNIEAKIAELTKLSITDLKSLAESGDSQSQVALADIYYLGERVDKDAAAARDLYRRASAQGSEIAVARLLKRYGTNKVQDDIVLPGESLVEGGHLKHLQRNGLLAINPLPVERVSNLYSTGIDLVGQDNESALTYLENAAENGHSEAQFYVGVAYVRGFGGDVDVERGLSWLIVAAENGTAAAKYKLGMMFKTGLLLERDAAQAQHWIAQAKAAGFPVDRSQGEARGKKLISTNPVNSTKSVSESRQTKRPVNLDAAAVRSQEWITERTQFYLSVVGLYDGPRDGVLNESLEQAIYRFQNKHRISADGKVSEKLLNRIKKSL